MPPTTGQLVIISGPSGVGKSTIVSRLVERFGSRLRLSISATTRPRRPGEVEGQHYYFLRSEEFASRLERGDFLEAMEVFGRGHWYGTLIDEVRPSLEAGTWVILEIDVDGAQKVCAQFPEAITIFLTVDSEAELERRLRQRATDSDDAIRRRLEVARRELSRAGNYDHLIVNRSVEEAVDAIADILTREGLKDD
jgi:guanylate kinase